MIEQTVQINGDIYCEGALVDTVNFEKLVEDHPDLEEIWISRIVDSGQILPPKNMLDSTANLCELFAATVGEDDVKLFKYHIKETILKPEEPKWTGTIIEIQVERNINFEWSHTNLENGCIRGREAAHQAYERYKDRHQRPKSQIHCSSWRRPTKKKSKEEKQGENGLSQLSKQCLGFAQVAGIEALVETAVDGYKNIMRLGVLVLIDPKPGQISRGAKLERRRLLAAGRS